MKRSLLSVILALRIVSLLAADTSTNIKVQNLSAFTRLYGYVKHFYPSDEAQEIDWDRFAALGSQKVQKARNMKQLKRSLEELFLPVIDLQLYTQQSPLCCYSHADEESLLAVRGIEQYQR